MGTVRLDSSLNILVDTVDSSPAVDTANKDINAVVPYKYLETAYQTLGVQGNWVGHYGSDGYLLAGFSPPSGTDLYNLPYVTYNLVQGAPFTWAFHTPTYIDTLQTPDQTDRNAGTYYHASAVYLDLTFIQDFTGLVSMYIEDPDANRTMALTFNNITVSIPQGGTYLGRWFSFPIQALTGQTYRVTVTNKGFSNAVISGVFFDSGIVAPGSADDIIAKLNPINSVTVRVGPPTDDALS